MLHRHTTGLGRARTLVGVLTALATLGFVLADAWSVIAVAVLMIATVLIARVDFGSLGERDRAGEPVPAPAQPRVTAS